MILEKALDKIVDKTIDGFGWIRKLAETKLWIASILGTLYIFLVIVGVIAGMVSALGLILTVAIGVLLLFAAILYAIGSFYSLVGGLVFFGTLFFIVFIIITLFMKKELKQENFYED